MKTRTDRVKCSWRQTLWFLRILPFFIALIVGLNALDDLTKGKPFNWMNASYGLGFLALTGLLGVWNWLIYRLALRYVEHRDRQKP